MAKAKPVDISGRKMEILKANSNLFIVTPIKLWLKSAGSVIGTESRLKLVVGSYPKTAIATELAGLKPIATSKGGNSAGAPTPSAVKKGAKPNSNVQGSDFFALDLMFDHFGNG